MFRFDCDTVNTFYYEYQSLIDKSDMGMSLVVGDDDTKAIVELLVLFVVRRENNQHRISCLDVVSLVFYGWVIICAIFC